MVTSLPARSRCAITPNGCGPPLVGTISIPRPSRNARNFWNTDSGLSRSAGATIEPAPTRITQRPACSKSPMWGSA